MILGITRVLVSCTMTPPIFLLLEDAVEETAGAALGAGTYDELLLYACEMHGLANTKKSS